MRKFLILALLLTGCLSQTPPEVTKNPDGSFTQVFYATNPKKTLGWITRAHADDFFPDTGGDGHTEGNDAVYATAGSTGTASSNSDVTFQFGQQHHAGSTTYYRWRGFLPFNTDTLPDTATVTAATLSLWGTAKTDNAGVTPTANVVSSTQVSPGSLVTSDHTRCGTTAFATISYAAFSTTGYNNFTLDASGIAQVNVTGYSLYCMRTNRDISGTAPSSGGNNIELFRVSSVEESGSTQDPKLTVTYTLPSASAPPKVLIFL